MRGLAECQHGQEAWHEKINNSAAILQAAIDGNGIALARSVMASPDLSITSALAYYIVYRPECAGLPRLAAFRNWLLSEAK